jgi:ABC-type antimicrobial peptide transport system permease subunit
LNIHPAVTLSCIGGIVGILIALGLCYGLAQVIKVPFNFNTQINVIAFAFSAVVGVLFGYTPARRAAARPSTGRPAGPAARPSRATPPRCARRRRC